MGQRGVVGAGVDGHDVHVGGVGQQTDEIAPDASEAVDGESDGHLRVSLFHGGIAVPVRERLFEGN